MPARTAILDVAPVSAMMSSCGGEYDPAVYAVKKVAIHDSSNMTFFRELGHIRGFWKGERSGGAGGFCEADLGFDGIVQLALGTGLSKVK
jgi:hypothetical protein